MKDKPKSLVKEVLIDATVSKVWEAITDKEAMKQWYFDLTAFKPEIGFEFQFEGGKDDKLYLHICKIIEVIPNKKLCYSWRYDGYPRNSHVTFELFEEGDKIRLKLTHEGIERFGTDNPDFARENFDAGWTYLIETAIKEFVQKDA